MIQHEEDILNEQVAHHQRVISEVEERRGEPLRERAVTPSIEELQRRLRERLKCATCGKTRVVLQLASYRRPWEIERVTAEQHCTCPPRVDADGSRHSGGPAWDLVSIECEHCDHGELVEMFDGYPERSLCGFCNGLGRVALPNAEQERAS
jgi:hypothetical protein